jgi:Family of unknown function (DUF5522)
MSFRKPERRKSDEFIENTDFYYENGLMVLTAHFLLKRGYCCENICRHCPYSKKVSSSVRVEDDSM